jgi:outer membrane protein assembly factor BamB
MTCGSIEGGAAMQFSVAIHKRFSAWCSVALLLGFATLCPAGDWPQWRGPLRSGHTDEVDLPLTWGGPDQTNVLWKAPADFGHSSPIVWGDRVFLTGSVKKSPRDKDNLAANHVHRVAGYRVKDGTKLWQTDIESGTWDTQFSFTAATPVTDGKHIFALFGSGKLAALDVDGKLLWQKQLTGPSKAEWLSSSPLLYRDTLFVFCDATDDYWLLALDKKTGAVQWERKRKQNDRAHNSSPLLITVKDQPQLVVAAAGSVMGLDPQADRVIWSCTWRGTRYPSLTPGPGLLYVADDGGEGLAIDPTGEGDVTKTHIKWRHKSPQGFGCPIIVGEYLFRSTKPDLVRCWKLSDGESVFEERLEKIPNYPSPIATKDGRIYFASADRSYVIKASPKLEVLGTSALEVERYGESGSSGPSPAVSNGRIFLRNPRALYCIGKK